MNYLAILSRLCQFIGFVRWAGALWHAHELKVKAQEIANSPTTRTELESTLEKGDL